MIEYKVYLFIWLVKLMFPKYWFLNTRIPWAHSRHETGVWTSKAFLEGNNLFGMNPSRNRGNHYDRFGPDEGAEEVAKFKSWYLSVKDYFERQVQFKVSSGNFMADTATNYATDPKFLRKWSIHVKQKTNVGWISKSIAFSGVVLIGGLMVFFGKKL